MAQVIVRNLDDSVKRKLQRRAAKHEHSMEAEIRDILRDAIKGEDRAEPELGTRIATMFKRIELDKNIPKLKIRLRIPKFDE